MPIESSISIKIHKSNNIVDISRLSPETSLIQFQIPMTFQYIGRAYIKLNETTPAEIDIFIEPDGNSNEALRYFLIQKEYHIPPSTKSYRYFKDSFIELFGLSWQIDSSIWYNALLDEKSDSTQTHRFAVTHGFTLPVYILSNRLMYIYGKRKNSELLLIYGEDAKKQPKGWDTFVKGMTLDDVLWLLEVPKLQERALQIITEL